MWPFYPLEFDSARRFRAACKVSDLSTRSPGSRRAQISRCLFSISYDVITLRYHPFGTVRRGRRDSRSDAGCVSPVLAAAVTFSQDPRAAVFSSEDRGKTLFAILCRGPCCLAFDRRSLVALRSVTPVCCRTSRIICCSVSVKTPSSASRACAARSGRRPTARELAPVIENAKLHF